MFESKQLCEVVASDERKLFNRILRTNLIELGGASSQLSMFTTLRFRITNVGDGQVSTILLGHEIAPSFMRTFARRSKSLIHQVVDETTKDNEGVRLKLIAVTSARVSENTKRNIRAILVEETKKHILEKNFDELMQDVIYGRVSSKLFIRLKQITKMRRVEIRRSERKEIFK